MVKVDLISLSLSGKLFESLCARYNKRICLDSPQLFFRCYYYFASAVFAVQCISVGYQDQDLHGCMLESITIK